VLRKVDISKIQLGESVRSLENFINGKRDKTTNWCDWDIPIHWGGLADPFQPAERVHKRSLEALKVFARTKYPFVVSTKATMLAEEPYFSLLKECNCVVQFSACSPQYNKIEKGAATYEQRIEAAAKISKVCRVNIRIQPFVPSIFKDVIKAIPEYAKAGVHGVILEAMKYTKSKIEGLVSKGGIKKEWQNTDRGRCSFRYIYVRALFRCFTMGIPNKGRIQKTSTDNTHRGL
jgi:DNA repair photolyase